MQNEDPFETYSEVAFRVEALPNYPDSDGHSAAVAFFQEHGHAPVDHNAEWRDMVLRAQQRGVLVQRLRFVSDPLSAYEEYEIRCGYRAGIEAGEDIRVAQKPRSYSGQDFWIYDWQTIEILEYDDIGRFVGSTVRPATVEEVATARDLYRMFQTLPPLNI